MTHRESDRLTSQATPRHFYWFSLFTTFAYHWGRDREGERTKEGGWAQRGSKNDSPRERVLNARLHLGTICITYGHHRQSGAGLQSESRHSMPSLSPFGLPQVQVAAAKCLQLNAHPLFCNYLSAFRGPEMPVKQLKISASAQFNHSPPPPSSSRGLANKWKNQKAIKTLHNRNVQKLLLPTPAGKEYKKTPTTTTRTTGKKCQTTKSKWGRHVNFSFSFCYLLCSAFIFANLLSGRDTKRKSSLVKKRERCK